MAIETSLAQTVRETAITKGVRTKTIDSEIKTTYLPKTGKFKDGEASFEIAMPNTNTAHIRILTECGNGIACGSVKALAFYGKLENVTTRKITTEGSPIKDGYVMTGTRAVNPHLQMKQHELVAFLAGKSFKATKKTLLTVRPKSDATGILPMTEQEVKDNIIEKDFYEIEILP